MGKFFSDVSVLQGWASYSSQRLHRPVEFDLDHRHNPFANFGRENHASVTELKINRQKVVWKDSSIYTICDINHHQRL